MQNHYDHANLTIRLPEFPLSATTRKRRRRSDYLEVPRPDSSRSDSSRTDSSRTDSSRTDSSRTDSSRTDSSRTVTPHSRPLHPRPATNFHTPANTPFPTPGCISSPPSLKNSPPFDAAHTPASSVFHVRARSIPRETREHHHHHHHHHHHRSLSHSQQLQHQQLNHSQNHHNHLQPPPLQQPNTPILSPSDHVVFPPSSRTYDHKNGRPKMTTGALGANLRHMGISNPDTPPLSPTPSPLVLSEPRGNADADYFSIQPTVPEITPPDEEDIAEGKHERGGYFPQQARAIATCASTVAGSSMQRWLKE